MIKKQTKKSKKVKKEVTKGKVYIKSTFSNTIVTITDEGGNVICWGSAGTYGYKGTRKSTPYAAGVTSRSVAEKAKEEYGLKEVEVYIKGIGSGRESAVRSLDSAGLKVTKIMDITPVPHNGCRPKKPRKP